MSVHRDSTGSESVSLELGPTELRRLLPTPGPGTSPERAASPDSIPSEYFNQPPWNPAHQGAALRIQCVFRRYRARKIAKARRQSRAQDAESVRLENAATCIQSTFRRYVARKRYSMLDFSPFRRHRQQSAATLIQSVFRRTAQQRRFEGDVVARQSGWQSIRENDACRMIQRQWRRFSAAGTTTPLAQSVITEARLDRGRRTGDAEVRSASLEQQFAALVIQRSHRRCRAQKELRRAFNERRVVLEQQAAFQEQLLLETASARIQRCWRMSIAFRKTEFIRLERLREENLIRQEEAKDVLVRFFRLLVAQSKRVTRTESWRQWKQDRVRSESATLIQARVRGMLQRQRYISEKHERDFTRGTAAATTIQSMYRCWRARKDFAIIKREAKLQAALELVNDAATTIQRVRRGQLARRRAHCERQGRNLVSLFSSLGRGYLSRFALGASWREVHAAKKIQRTIRTFLSVRRAQQLRKVHQRRLRQRAEHASVLIIQRNVRRWLERETLPMLRFLQSRRVTQAVRIQRLARAFLARNERKRLTLNNEATLVGLQWRQAAELVQALVRGFLVRLNQKRLNTKLANARSIIRAAASGHLDRRRVHILYRQSQAAKAAVVIQRHWAKFCSTKFAIQQAQRRRSFLEQIRNKNRSAVVIQRLYKGFKQRQQSLHVQTTRRVAAIKVQCLIRCFFAKRALRALKLQAAREKAARRIQLKWEEAREGIIERRIQREMERKLQRMEEVSLLRGELHHRTTIAADEEEEFLSFSKECTNGVEAILDKEQARLQAWRKRAPVELQEDSAVKIQSAVRRFQTRGKVADYLHGLEEEKETESKALLPIRISARLRGIDMSLRRKGRTTTGSPSAPVADQGSSDEIVEDEEDFGGDMGGWLRWLSQQSLTNKRCFERLLQREAAARRRIIEDYDNFMVPTSTKSSGGSTSAQATPPSGTVTTPRQLPPIVGLPHTTKAGTQARHLAALNSAIEVTRRTNSLLSQHPSALEQPTSVSRLAVQTFPGPGRSHNLPINVGEVSPDIAPDSRGTVDLSRLPLTEALLRPILHSLRTHPSVVTLSLAGLSIRDASCIDIADFIQHTSSLKHLSVANTNLSDVGVTHLIAALKRNDTVETVDVSGTCVTERYRGYLSALLSQKVAKRKHQEELDRSGPANRSSFAAPRRQPQSDSSLVKVLPRLPKDKLNSSQAA